MPAIIYNGPYHSWPLSSGRHAGGLDWRASLWFDPSRRPMSLHATTTVEASADVSLLSDGFGITQVNEVERVDPVGE